MSTATQPILVFPIPKSGRFQIVPTEANTFDVECVGLNGADHGLLRGFYVSAKNAFGSFSFNTAVCRIQNVDSIQIRLGSHNTVAVTIQ